MVKALKAGDRFLARLLSRSGFRWIVQAAVGANAVAALWLRVVQGRAEQVLPWQGALLSLYAFAMAAACSDRRATAGWGAFGALILAAFTRGLTGSFGRMVGVVEVAGCLVLLGVLRALSRDERFLRRAAVLESAET